MTLNINCTCKIIHSPDFAKRKGTWKWKKCKRARGIVCRIVTISPESIWDCSRSSSRKHMKRMENAITTIANYSLLLFKLWILDIFPFTMGVLGRNVPEDQVGPEIFASIMNKPWFRTPPPNHCNFKVSCKMRYFDHSTALFLSTAQQNYFFKQQKE